MELSKTDDEREKKQEEHDKMMSEKERKEESEQEKRERKAKEHENNVLETGPLKTAKEKFEDASYKHSEWSLNKMDIAGKDQVNIKSRVTLAPWKCKGLSIIWIKGHPSLLKMQGWKHYLDQGSTLAPWQFKGESIIWIKGPP